MTDQTADQIADQINAHYNHLSTQYRAVIAEEDAAWTAVGTAAGPASHQALTAYAEQVTEIRRRLSRELDAELARLTAGAGTLARKITGRG